MALIERLLALALEKNVILTCAESCTGGLLAAALTEMPGSSAIFDRGFVTYTNAAKHEMLGVSLETLDQFGAVSPEVAREMAQGALAHSGAKIAVSITGIAGPGGSDHKPEGRVCFALACENGTEVQTQEFGALGRGNVRSAARDHALQMLLESVRKAHTN